MRIQSEATETYHQRRQRLYERDGGICQLCKSPVAFEEMELDHIIPRALGGDDGESNVQVSHRRCNRSKRDKLGELTIQRERVRKTSISFRLKDETRRLLAMLAAKKGVGEAAIMEMLVREAATREGAQ